MPQGEQMPRLILKFNDQVISELFVKEGMITIGRHSDNTIAIDHFAISRYHARIDKAGNDYIISDLQSTNGTFVNSEKITSPRILANNDVILIGKHVINFVGAEGEEFPPPPGKDEGPFDGGKTQMLDKDYEKDILARIKEKPSPAQHPEPVGVLGFLDGTSLREVELTRNRITIGNAEGSDIRLSGLFMGSTAAVITRNPRGYMITFVGGLSKLRVNGEIVKDTVRLKDLDLIKIGPHRLQFYIIQKES
jgi:pSer/pThr/pTyr-binding forkhead associated (FHA) protein